MLGQGEGVGRSATPLQVGGLTNIVRLTAGSGFTCALSADGRLFCWGGNEFGQLGNRKTEASVSPAEVLGLE
jgi:alpha-tubulin suppressor-like RCC1 family protein